jgi:CubicO group peptidase (beta-lactamase class C family)
MPPLAPIVLYLAHMLIADIPELMRRAAVPGVSIASVAQGAITPAAFGVLRADQAEPITPESLFEAASLSKPVFAYAVLGLAREGGLALDQPLTHYLPTPFVEDDARLGEVTTRHVLAHTTGWPNWRPRGEPLRREAPPGERFGYSGEGFVYLQRVVEHITEQPLEAFMQSRVLGPLGMTRSSFSMAHPSGARLATGHDQEGRPLPLREPQPPNAAFSLHSTASDMARFVEHVMTEPGDMLTAQVRVNERVSWALGWGLEAGSEGRAFWHWGDNPGYKSFAIGLPDHGTGAVVMTNADGGRPLCAWAVERLLGTDHPALEWLARRYQAD